jgi:hypothetical protein
MSYLRYLGLLVHSGIQKITQPKVSERIINVRAQVQASGSTSEDDFGNDFDPGMIETCKGKYSITNRRF